MCQISPHNVKGRTSGDGTCYVRFFSLPWILSRAANVSLNSSFPHGIVACLSDEFL